ncbi:MAG: peptidoglycan DD-metalloendopeptidase family protein [Acidobacteria bacterium]|nr:peptidoglycan DD-metalloendopeptidase family protein [Acidobacteriota bacterium]
MANDPIRLRPDTATEFLRMAPNLAGELVRLNADRTRDSDETAKLAEVAREFEALLLAQLLNQMRQSVFSEDEEDGFGSETMLDTVHAEMARHLSRRGGIGLAESLIRGLERRQEGVQTPQEPDFSLPNSGVNVSPTPAIPASLGRAASSPEPANMVRLPVTDQVSSAFGWRSDPFTAQPKFHAGVDFAAAYGSIVPAPAEGRVIFAGEQSGYGLAVVVEHRPGLQTRYAHLSSMDVQEGDRVGAGQPVGRVGQSGRARGTHLHFEVIQDGQRVDPMAVASAQSPSFLKKMPPDADFFSGRDPSAPTLPGADHED